MNFPLPYICWWYSKGKAGNNARVIALDTVKIIIDRIILSKVSSKDSAILVMTCVFFQDLNQLHGSCRFMTNPSPKLDVTLKNL